MAALSTTIGYDAIGNITSKTGVGSYTYDATKKHAVANAGGAAYIYDANGNLTSRNGATVSWTSYNLPSSISDPSGYSAQFVYAPDRSRLKQISTYAGGTETTIYVAGLFEKLTTTTRTHWKHLIPTPSGQVQVIRRSDGTNDTFYVTTDHLGSTDAVLNAAGTVLMRGSFTVHGARRASNWQGAPSSTEWQSIANTTRLGYTGHEQIDNILLVHMNGRVFDPTIGRFLSADPYIDGPETTQGWNRYAYVHGRLMSATDPSGYETCHSDPDGKFDERCLQRLRDGFTRFLTPWVYVLDPGVRPRRPRLDGPTPPPADNPPGSPEQEALTPQRRCSAPADVSKVEAFGAAAAMSFQWLIGLGDDNRVFGADSIQSAQLRDAPGVNAARSFYLSKFAGQIGSGSDLTGNNVTNFSADFGLGGYLSATWRLDATEHFVGSYRVDIYGGSSGTARFELSNNSSFKSFGYGVTPAWERSTFGPMGNVRQTYTWTECVQ